MKMLDGDLIGGWVWFLLGDISKLVCVFVVFVGGGLGGGGHVCKTFLD